MFAPLTRLHTVVSYLISSSNHNLWLRRSARAEVVSYLISSSNHNCMLRNCLSRASCVLSYFIIKPQLLRIDFDTQHVVSYLISSSNHNRARNALQVVEVVSYLISSSNHNCNPFNPWFSEVVSYLISSSNHNTTGEGVRYLVLCLILFHHQTTTHIPFIIFSYMLCLILFHHQTTTCRLYTKV